jgi:hypothetical protein
VRYKKSPRITRRRRAKMTKHAIETGVNKKRAVF